MTRHYTFVDLLDDVRRDDRVAQRKAMISAQSCDDNRIERHVSLRDLHVQLSADTLLIQRRSMVSATHLRTSAN